MHLSLICALAENGAIGLGGDLLYHLREDMLHFKSLTTGHTVLMGRRTFESLPKGALPNRRNLVVTRQTDYQAPNVEVFHSFEDALGACAEDEEVYVIGGESIYAAALPYADRLCLTHIHATPSEADTFFPAYDAAGEKVDEERHDGAGDGKPAFTFANYRRRGK